MFRQFFRNRFGQKRDASNLGAGRGRGQGRGAGQGQGGNGGGFGRTAGGGGGGRGGGNKPYSGPGGNCVCPQCGKKVPHVAGQRCVDQVCPDCGTKMTRE
jgi:hypothetical protein